MQQVVLAWQNTKIELILYFMKCLHCVWCVCVVRHLRAMRELHLNGNQAYNWHRTGYASQT